jgi:hypothetical protein
MRNVKRNVEFNVSHHLVTCTFTPGGLRGYVPRHESGVFAYAAASIQDAYLSAMVLQAGEATGHLSAMVLQAGEATGHSEAALLRAWLLAWNRFWRSGRAVRVSRVRRCLPCTRHLKLSRCEEKCRIRTQSIRLSQGLLVRFSVARRGHSLNHVLGKCSRAYA